MWPGSSRVGGVAPTYDTPVPDVGRGYAPDTRAPSVARVTFRQTPRHRRSGLRPRRPASSPYPGFRFRQTPHLVVGRAYAPAAPRPLRIPGLGFDRSEEHTSELQSLMRISYAAFCLKKKKNVNCR